MLTSRFVLVVLFLSAGTSFATTIHGRVLHANDASSRTKVTLDYENGKHLETTSNAKGEFEFRDVPDGPVDLSAATDGASIVRRGICIRAGENVWEVLLEGDIFTPCDAYRSESFSELRITGQVVDQEDHPLSGAAVKAIVGDGLIADTQFTDDKGQVVLRFEYGEENETDRIRIERKGYDMRVINSPCDLNFTAQLFPRCSASSSCDTAVVPSP